MFLKYIYYFIFVLKIILPKTEEYLILIQLNLRDFLFFLQVYQFKILILYLHLFILVMLSINILLVCLNLISKFFCLHF